MLLKGKVCIIVGAASLRGIGYATAELFAEHGAKVVAVDVTMNDQMVSEIKTSIDKKTNLDADIIGLRCDISKAEDCDRVISEVITRYGTIDCLVNSAAVVKSQSLMEIEQNDFDVIMNVNLKGAFNLCRSVLKVFSERKNGVIVNVASVAAQRGGGLVGGAHYAASKGGVLSLTRSIAREFGPLGIRANVVCPSMTETGMLDGNVSDEKFKEIIDAIPLKRAGKARDIAGACLFLVSDLSAYVTGATVDVNGGSHIH
ncbi:NAD(P)-dependent dehydrogenase, short-chain alcohol dehydrogenase family [Collimonas sp. OK607]|uniref:SDR family NAD(P)-dependent oxidoreductase n=1 Tax=Collimonas sp. OK607 TaxID=1798194 RepID=UPI0008DFE23A|nr:SDR family oxidoreductase [Collimonas sp. OK607]SFB21012.1 NAD(P)-dependent dehydrogenase, short-chain alcohol dehydrogenase family [Collimonas sp. OK607]